MSVISVYLPHTSGLLQGRYASGVSMPATLEPRIHKLILMDCCPITNQSPGCLVYVTLQRLQGIYGNRSLYTAMFSVEMRPSMVVEI